MRLKLAFVALCLFFPMRAHAQTHYCDTTPAVTGNGIVGATLTVSACDDGKDSTGSVTVAPTGWNLYDNGVASPITMTKGTTSPVSGKTVYTGSYKVPATAGSHALQTTKLAGALEGAKSATFTLTAIAPTPSAPTNLSVQ